MEKSAGVGARLIGKDEVFDGVKHGNGRVRRPVLWRAGRTGFIKMESLEVGKRGEDAGEGGVGWACTLFKKKLVQDSGPT